MSRPTSVTVICWILLALCAINLISIANGFWQDASGSVFKNPVSAIEALIGIAVAGVCAIFMLRGANWARWLYLGWVVLGTIALAFMATTLLAFMPGAIKTVVFGYFLTRADANHFFRPKRNDHKTDSSAA